MRMIKNFGNKLLEFQALDIDVKVCHLINGNTDKEFKTKCWYNCDLEDVLRNNR